MTSTPGQSDRELVGQRRAQLEAAKLRSLARRHAGAEGGDPGSDSGVSDTAVPGLVFIDDRVFGLAVDVSDLGRLLHQVARTRKADGSTTVTGLTIFAESEAASVIARRVSLLQPSLADLDVEVQEVDGAQSVSAVAADMLIPPVLDVKAWTAASSMADAGARVIDDHGRLVAEVMGLEVARLTPDGIRVGVGEADRELQVYLNSHLEDGEALARAVQTVSDLRPVPSHPLNRLARPRWLRSVLMDDPSLVELTELQPLAPLTAADGVFDREPSAAYCPPAAGAAGTTVVCSVGVDLNLVPEAFEYRQRTDPDSRLMLVLPERDRHLAVEPLRVLFSDPSDLTVRSVQAPWESVRS